MAIQKIEAYRCSYCGKIMRYPEMHEFECRYEPKSRTCTTCGYSSELRCGIDDLRDVCYCPRTDKIFRYPCSKYCPDHKKSPEFVEGGQT